MLADISNVDAIYIVCGRTDIVKCLLENFIKNKAETGTLDILAYSCY